MRSNPRIIGLGWVSGEFRVIRVRVTEALLYYLKLVSNNSGLRLLLSDQVHPSIQSLLFPSPLLVNARSLTQNLEAASDSLSTVIVWLTCAVSTDTSVASSMFSSNILYPITIPFTWSRGTGCQVTENDVEFIGEVNMLTGARLGTMRERRLISYFVNLLNIFTEPSRAFYGACNSVELKKMV